MAEPVYPCFAPPQDVWASPEKMSPRVKGLCVTETDTEGTEHWSLSFDCTPCRWVLNNLLEGLLGRAGEGRAVLLRL